MKGKATRLIQAVIVGVLGGLIFGMLWNLFLIQGLRRDLDLPVKLGVGVAVLTPPSQVGGFSSFVLSISAPGG